MATYLGGLCVLIPQDGPPRSFRPAQVADINRKLGLKADDQLDCHSLDGIRGQSYGFLGPTKKQRGDLRNKVATLMCKYMTHVNGALSDTTLFGPQVLFIDPDLDGTLHDVDWPRVKTFVDLAKERRARGDLPAAAPGPSNPKADCATCSGSGLVVVGDRAGPVMTAVHCPTCLAGQGAALEAQVSSK